MKFFLLLLMISANVYPQSSDSFVVHLYDNKVRVMAPKMFTETVSLIIENKTLSQIRGKITSTINPAKYFTIEPNNNKSAALKVKKGEKLAFIPIAPAFQEVKLEFGLTSYEIPEKN